MAKKKKEEVKEEPQIETVVAEAPAPKPEPKKAVVKQEPKAPSWEIKNRVYYLKGKKKPYDIEFTFYRKTKRKFDYINAAQIVQDLMVKYGWLDDDNCTEMKPYFGNYVHQKKNPGVLIKIL